MEQKTWFAVDIVVHPAATEPIESAFNELGALGTEIDSLKKGKAEPVCVTGYFDSMPEEALINGQANESLRVYGMNADSLISIGSRTVEQIDWLAEWKKHWKPTAVGKFVIAPPWAALHASDKQVITIEPNMAFGTGTHETTQLCLGAISELYQPGMSFLDVGTGTGILAIAAAKLGAGSIEACDTDADSVMIAKQNAAANGVADAITFSTGSIEDGTSVFDFVCANLTLDVIAPMLPLLLERSRHVLVLSGILSEQRQEVETRLKTLQVRDQKYEVLGEWLSVTAFLKE